MKKIEGVPESISHKQVLEACAVLGLEPKLVRAIRISPRFVEVVLYATQPVRLKADHVTQPYVGVDGIGSLDEPATHTVYYDLLADSSGDD